VAGHKRYANPTRSLNKPDSAGNIVSVQQASHGAHRGALRQSHKERRSQKQHKLEGTLAFLEWT